MGLRRSAAVKFQESGTIHLKKNLSIKKSLRESNQKNNDGVYEKNASNLKEARFKKEGPGRRLGECVTGTAHDIRKIEMRESKIDVNPKFNEDDPNDQMDIQANWDRVDLEKKANAMMYQQGNVRYKHEDEIKIKKEEADLQLDGSFHFDPDISPENRFITFKATVIGRNLNLASGDEPNEEEVTGEELFVTGESKSRATGNDSKAEVNTHIKKQAEFMQKGQAFPSEGARRLDAAYREVDFMST